MSMPPLPSSASIVNPAKTAPGTSTMRTVRPLPGATAGFPVSGTAGAVQVREHQPE
ncbi:hypothetical protein ACWEOI_17340 [Nocardia sp. NPDC004340]